MTAAPASDARRPMAVIAVTGFVVALLTLFAGVGAAGADSSQPASAPAPNVIVQPATGLTDGLTVQVSGAGFSPLAQIAVGECAGGATTPNQCSVAGSIVVLATVAGTFTTPFTVSRMITIGGSPIDCADPGACLLGAGQLPDFTTHATTPIAFAASAPPPVPPASPSTRYYLALGDSLATGFGAPTGQGYVDDLAAFYRAAVPGLQVEDLGCSGETTTTFRDGGRCTYAAGTQLAAAEEFLAAHAGQVALVTIDVGGDDITGCASTTPPFPISSSCVASAVQTVSANLDVIGAGLRAAAGASVPIVGMTYFDPFVVEWLSGPDGQAAARTSVTDLGELNGALSAAYRSFGAQVADVEGAFSSSDFTDLVPSAFGTIPKNVAVACSWLLVVCSTTSPVIVGVHPNATGYGVIAATYESVLPTSALGSTVPPTTPPPTTPGPKPAPIVPTLAFSGFPAAELGGIGAGGVLLGAGLIVLSRRRWTRSPARRST